MLRLFISVLLISTVLGQEKRAHKCGLGTYSNKFTLTRSVASRGFDYLDESALSPSGRFRIHFTRSGDHAVSGGSSPGIPDFVNEAGIAADSAYNLIVNTLGFLPPNLDGGIDGAEYDIYLKELNGDYYGETPVFSGTSYGTYLILDNDYQESSYPTGGLDGLRVTIAHEFFHMVQLSYSNPFQPFADNPYWFEISSTWIEEVCYPGINDYHYYVQDNFSQIDFPNLNDNSFLFQYSYGHGLFGQVLDQEYGSSGGKHIMLDIWENLGSREATNNLASVLGSSRWNTSLTDALGKYALYNVFTGSRSLPGEYYADAAELPEVSTRNYQIAADFPESFDFDLDPVGFGFKRFTAQNISNLLVQGNRLTSTQRVYCTFHDFDSGSSLKTAISSAWFPCDSVRTQDYMIFPMANGDRAASASLGLTFGGDTLNLATAIQSLWPNPVDRSQEFIQLNLVLHAGGNITLNIFDIRGRLVQQKYDFIPDGVNIVTYELPADLQSGLYIFQVIAGNTAKSSKFTVLK